MVKGHAENKINGLKSQISKLEGELKASVVAGVTHAEKASELNVVEKAREKSESLVTALEEELGNARENIKTLRKELTNAAAAVKEAEKNCSAAEKVTEKKVSLAEKLSTEVSESTEKAKKLQKELDSASNLLKEQKKKATTASEVAQKKSLLAEKSMASERDLQKKLEEANLAAKKAKHQSTEAERASVKVEKLEKKLKEAEEALKASKTELILSKKSASRSSSPKPKERDLDPLDSKFEKRWADTEKGVDKWKKGVPGDGANDPSSMDKLQKDLEAALKEKTKLEKELVACKLDLVEANEELIASKLQIHESGKSNISEIEAELANKSKLLKSAVSEIKGLREGMSYLEDELHKADEEMEEAKRIQEGLYNEIQAVKAGDFQDAESF